jgi:hypothetical protein
MLLNFIEDKMQVTKEMYMIVRDYNINWEATWLRGREDVTRKPIYYDPENYTCIFIEKTGRIRPIRELNIWADEYVFVKTSYGFKDGKPAFVEYPSYEFVILGGKICFINSAVSLGIRMFDRLDRSEWNDRVYIATTKLAHKDSKEELMDTSDNATKTRNLFYLERTSDTKPEFRFVRIARKKGEPDKFTYSLPFIA